MLLLHVGIADCVIHLYSSEESEKVSELKSVTGSSRLPYGTLASGSEGIREAILGFDDAYVYNVSFS